MPVEDGVGYGHVTPIKVEHMRKIFAMHLAITKAVLNRNEYFIRRYRYLDLTAGKGATPDGNPGSPIIFLEQAESSDFGFPYRADFIESNPNSIRELRESVDKAGSTHGWKLSDVHFHAGSYQEIAPDLLSTELERELGLIFVDHSGDIPQTESLSSIVQLRPRMEILLYIPTTNLKRVYQHSKLLLSDFMNELDKQHWLVRRPVKGDSHKWTFLLGSNTSLFKNYKSIDFVRMDSKEAKSFFPELNYTKKQRFEQIQPRLFD